MDSQINPLGVLPYGAGSTPAESAPDSQDVVTRYLTMAVRSAPLDSPPQTVRGILQALPPDAPFAEEVHSLADALQAGGAQPNPAALDFLQRLVDLVQRPDMGFHEVAIRGLLGLARDFASPEGQPTGLSPVHAEALTRLARLIGNQASALDVMIAIYDIRRFALEGARPQLGVYSGLTWADVNAVPGLPGLAPSLDLLPQSDPPGAAVSPVSPPTAPTTPIAPAGNQPQASSWLDSVLADNSL